MQKETKEKIKSAMEIVRKAEKEIALALLSIEQTVIQDNTIEKRDAQLIVSRFVYSQTYSVIAKKFTLTMERVKQILSDLENKN